MTIWGYLYFKGKRTNDGDIVPSVIELQRCATNILDSIDPKASETVFLTGSLHTQELLEEIAFQCYQRGAYPFISTTSDNYSRRVIDEISEEILSATPIFRKKIFDTFDCFIIAEPFQNPAVQNRFLREKDIKIDKLKLATINELGDAIYDRLYSKRYVYVAWPSSEMAKYYDVEYITLESSIIRGMSIPNSIIEDKARTLMEIFSHGEVLHIWDSKDTDFTIDLKDIPLFLADMKIDSNDLKMNRRGLSFPSGELCLVPKPFQVDGTFHTDYSLNPLTGQVLHDVHLRFEAGELLFEDIFAENLRSFKEALRYYLTEDSAIGASKKSHLLAKVGIGLNPGIRPIGLPHIDRNAAGTINLRFGGNIDLHGDIVSTMNWEFTSSKKINADVYIKKEPVPIIIEGDLLPEY